MLKELNEEQLAKTAECLDLLNESNASNLALKKDLKAAQDALKLSEKKLNGLEGEAATEVGRLREELAAVARDRDSLIAVIDQQEVALKLQNRQSEAGQSINKKGRKQSVIDNHFADVQMIQYMILRLISSLAAEVEGQNREFISMVDYEKEDGFVIVAM